MIELAVYNRKGDKIDNVKVDENLLGGRVRHDLLKQAIVMYHANKRVGTASNKGRSEVAGSGRKLFRQKGTGNARVGNIRTNKRVGGGVAFAKKARDFGKRMPKAQKRLACKSAVLAKMLSENIIVIDELNFDKPKTKEFASVLGNLKINRSCLVSVGDYDENLYKSLRNVPRIALKLSKELNAGDICNYSKMLITKVALESLINQDKAE